MNPFQDQQNLLQPIGLSNQGTNAQTNNPQNTQIPIDNRRHRRSKHDPNGRNFHCDCGKSFLSKPALNNHIKNKHPDTLEGQIKRGRGRPRKYPPKAVSDFENTKYPNFFTQENRKAKEGQNIDNEMPNIIKKVFDDLFKGQYKEKLFSTPQKVEEDPVFNSLLNKNELNENNNNINNKDKKEKNCNEIFYEYLSSFKNDVNVNYFTLMLKFVILFRECYDKSKSNNIILDGTKKVGCLNPEGLPDLCNEFYGEFLEPNNFFGIEEQDEKDEIIELIQHFCIWLFRNEYTKSKLSLATN